MNTREPRLKVILPARIRIDGKWLDASIRNLSARGLMIDSNAAIDRGTYVEVRRGRHIVVGRAMWRKGRQVGIRAQDRIDLDGIVSHPEALPTTRTGGLPERRRQARPPVTADGSAMLGSWLQRGAVGVMALAAAGVLAQSAHETLRQPFERVGHALVADGGRIVRDIDR